jgi:very-short-patch-repair endonuclease
MSFLPVPEVLLVEDEERETPPLPELLEEMYGSDRHADNRLQTKLGVDRLDKRLLKISTEANTYYQEQGVDILYLALGFLTWFEDRNSDKPRKAPLVLIPVALDRSSAQDRFKLTYTQADLGPNLSLEAKLKMEFQLTLPEFGEYLNIDTYFSEVQKRIGDQPRWKLNENDIALGFFSFGKFQMYQDLNPDNWPDDKSPANHTILKSLLGGGFSSERVSVIDGGISNKGENFSLPDLTQLHFVKDADSSQSEAVMAIKRGENLVIQGPPGTGKSQTITNIIAESLADEKTVLFVAEKMAALEVVKRRLDECHLGTAVLELHSHKSNKRMILEELKRTLELGRPNTRDRSHEKTRHSQLSQRLDDYCEAVNTPILNSGVSYIDALGYHLQLKAEAGEYVLPELDFTPMRQWTVEDYAQACAYIQELIDHLQAMGVPANNAFSQSSLEDFSPVAQNKLVGLLQQTRVFVLECQLVGKQLAREMALKPPETVRDVEAICRAAQRALDAPHLKGLALTTDDWQQRGDQIKVLLTAGSEIGAIKQARGGQLIEQAWKADLLTARQLWATTGKKWWRFISGDFRRAKQQLQGLLAGMMPADAKDCLAIIDDILKVQTLNEQYQRHERLGERLFGAQWQGLDSDWPVLSTLSDWVVELYQQVGKGDIPEGLLRFLEGDNSLSDWKDSLSKLDKASQSLQVNVNHLYEQLVMQTGVVKQAVADQPLDQLHESVDVWLGNIDNLYQMTRYNRIRGNLTSNGLTAIDALAFDWCSPPALLLTVLKRSWFEGLVNEAYSQSEAIKQFDRISHEGAIKEFKKLDSDLFHYAQELLVNNLHARLPHASSAGEMAIVRREMNKKRRHMPLRRLLKQAGRAIQQVKPVFMMSPMSVATYLEQGVVDFDLVVFDEASQVKVVDAIGPILRGKQVVVVGDTKQMPPTDFFGKALELDDEEAEQSHTADIESILSMFLSKGVPESMLRWHYRSRHDSLITVSNQEFYDGKLMIFPSPGVNSLAKGLSFNHVPEAIYERGASRTNPIEARKIAEAVMQYARRTPQLTLGVVAFSTAQRDCIILELERMRRDDTSCEEFFNGEALEGFFVKNLENVQGDERDTIFISVGYGRTAAGTVSKSFGPINREGGERRLNVLITRARLAMEVFCNFTADELATKSDSPFGVRVLKSFLHYAQTGDLENRKETGKDTDSPFEDEVISAIQGLGYDVEPQVGSAGFYIDIAVRDPSKPGRYILAVECDGASYHSSVSARDRDRLRQDVLEGLGWRFHRIWSTDWFRNPYKETERLKGSIERAIRYYRELDEINERGIKPTKVIKGSQPKIIERSSTGEKSEYSANAYKVISGAVGIRYGAEIHELNMKTINQAILKVLSCEGPIHIKEVARRITESAGYTRVGSRIMSHVEKAGDAGHRAGNFHLFNEFIYPDSSKSVEIRDRSNLPAAMKKIELVPSEEMSAALMKAVEMAFSLTEQDAIAEGLSLMGFQRATEKARGFMEDELKKLIAGDKLVQSGELVSLG